jgi:iron complex outermembrane recepter protein
MTNTKGIGQSGRAALKHGILVALCSASATLSVAALAQTVPSGGLEEVVVTAQRRESNLQSTPIAVSAVDAQVIADLAPRTISDLAWMVPNFSANKINGFNAASFAMRGVGNTDIIVYNEAPVAVLVDDFVMPSVQTQLLDPFDVQEVEVLRGPQGTLFGKNTTGGAVVVRTKAPLLNETTFEAQAQAGSYNAFSGQGAINFPLIDNTLALRIVASQEREDGWMRNGASDTIKGTTYTGDGSRLGGSDVFTGRAKLLWQPMDNLKLLFTYERLNDRSPAPGALNTTPTNNNPATGLPYFAFALLGLGGYTGNDPLNNAGSDQRDGYLINLPHGHRVDADGEHLNIDWTTTAGTLTWVQGYRSQDSSLPSNYTGVVGPVSVFDANRSDRRKTWQEELRFASTQIGNFNYVAGAFYQHDNTRFCVAQILGITDLFGVATPAGLQPGGYNNNPSILCNAQTETSKALYGEANYKFTDATTLTIGGRITEDNKDWIGRTQVLVQKLPSPTGAIVPGFTYEQLGGLMNAADFTAFPYGVVTDSHSWTQPSYRVTLSHQFDPVLFGYATFSHGFRAGGYNDQVGTSQLPITADEKKPTNPEKADSFEVGMKSEFFDRRLRLNEALFYVKYKDAIRQVVVPVTTLSGTPGEETLFKNAAQMTAYGIENELTAQLAEGLLLRLPISYQHCKYGSFTSGEGAAAVDLSRLPVNRCPEWTATLGLSYALPVAQTSGRIVLDANANYVSKNLDTYSIVLPYESWTQTYADGRTLVNASVTYTAANDRWFVRVLARNLANKIYRESGQDVDPYWIWTFYGEPRFVGGQIGVKFGQK